MEDTLVIERLKSKKEKNELEKEQRLAQKEEEAEAAELEARKAKALAEKSEAEARAKRAIEPPQSSQEQQPKTEMDKFKDDLGKEVNKGKKIDMIDIELNKRIKILEERAKQEGWSFGRFEEERDLEIARFQQFSQKNIK